MIDLTIKGRIASCLMLAPPVNAISESFLEAFQETLDRIERNPEVHVLVIRSGLKHFCAGADLTTVRQFFQFQDGAQRMVAFVRKFHELFNRIEALPLVTVAVIQGVALGGGLELALSCDLRITSDDAEVGMPEARLGMIPGAGGTQRLTKLCGVGVASKLILSAEILSGREAADCGIAQWSVPTGRLDSKAEEISERIASLSRDALAASKDCIRAYHRPDVDGFERELEKPLILMETSDSLERIAKFFADREATGARRP
jgi:enoyl-CoA hydratase